jgi:putative ABC transport system substrate-binding protein
LEIRSAEEDQLLLAEKAADLVRLRVDVIVVFQTPVALAARQTTSEIPIVMGYGEKHTTKKEGGQEIQGRATVVASEQ